MPLQELLSRAAITRIDARRGAGRVGRELEKSYIDTSIMRLQLLMPSRAARVAGDRGARGCRCEKKIEVLPQLA